MKLNSAVLGALVAVLTLQWTAPAQNDPGRQVQTIFAESCYGCHGAGQQMGNLRLDSNPGKAVIPGNSADSLLMTGCVRSISTGGLVASPRRGGESTEAILAISLTHLGELDNGSKRRLIEARCARVIAGCRARGVSMSPHFA